jgi:pilus assembly protein TadC
MTLAALTGLGLGVGLCLLMAGLRPGRPSLASTLRRLDRPPARRPPPARVEPLAATDRARLWMGRRLTGPVAAARDSAPAGLGGSWDGSRRGLLSPELAADLAVTSVPAELHAGAKVLSGLVGLLVPALLTVLLALTGLHLPLLVPLWVSLSAGAVGLLLPDVRLRRTAAATRRAFRSAVGAFLDLVAMRMASGAGLAEALHDAAAVGAGPAFGQIRGALADARTDGLSPAQALSRLGEQLHVPDLVDTGTRLRLVDASGAQAQASLRAQAASLRDRELADAQGRAGEQSQSMLVAQVVLGLGFVLFLGYPAVARVLAT